jgi:hypothetical protein
VTAPPTDSPEAAFRPLFEFWSQYFDQSAEQTRALLHYARETTDPLALRRLWLDALARNLEVYLRSPPFLEAMRRNLEVMTRLKDTAEDLARGTDVPRGANVGELFELLRGGQEAILSHLVAIEQRLETLEGKRMPEK